MDVSKAGMHNSISLNMNAFKPKERDKGPVSTSLNDNGAVIFNRSFFNSNISNDTLKNFSNDMTKLKLSLKNEAEGGSPDELSKLFDDFSSKINKYKEEGLFANNTDGEDVNQILQNSVLDMVDDFQATAANEMCQNDLKEMQARTNMGMFLIKCLGITNGRVDWSEKGIAEMMEQYKERLKNGTLSESAEIHDVDAFDKYCEQYFKDIKTSKSNYEEYSSLWLKIDDTKNLLKSNKLSFSKEPINDNFISREEATTSAVKFSSFEEMIAAGKAAKKAAIDAATGEEKKDLEMRMYWGEYTDMFFGNRWDGSRNYNINMETMYSQAADIYKQIEESSDSEETKASKFKALENALSTSTGMYKMRMVGEKLKADALEAEAQGKTIDRLYRSKAKFDRLSEMSNVFHKITSTFFNNLKSGNTESINYGSIITDAVSKIMSYKHPN